MYNPTCNRPMRKWGSRGSSSLVTKDVKKMPQDKQDEFLFY